MNPESVKIGLFVVLAIDAVLGLVFWSRLIECLRNEHRQVWEEIGSPSLINQSPAGSWRLWMFFMRGRSRALENPGLNRKARHALAASVIGAALIIAIFVVDWGMIGN